MWGTSLSPYAGSSVPDLSDAPDPARPIDAQRAVILRRLLGLFRPGTLADLACGAGWFATLAADAGWQVTALDARRRPWPDHERVTWREQDVRDAGLTGFGLILCLGIFYHLELPDQVKLLGKCAGTPLILDTHVSLAGGETAGGYTGHWYAEGGENTSHLSSWGNPRSFWPTKESLLRMLGEHGYTVLALEPWYHGEDRTFFLCLP